MSLKLITPPTAQAISLQEATLHLRVDGPDEDTLIAACIIAATQACEQATGRAIMPQTYELALDAFPEAFELTRVPVANVVSLKYTDESGTLITLDSSLYSLDNTSDCGFAYVVPAFGEVWPTARAQINAVALRYTAGWPDAASVPESIKAWIKLQVGAMYENRQAEGHMQTFALGFADRLLDRYKLWGA
jgi:uncharacterized phiE125 gp8 family phage protein